MVGYEWISTVELARMAIVWKNWYGWKNKGYGLLVEFHDCCLVWTIGLYNNFMNGIIRI